jgi:hypothetical protein
MEKMVATQIASYLYAHDKLHATQHEFIVGRSTMTNLAQFDKHIADCLASGHSFDIISFDFCKAFDNAPHQAVLNAAAEIGINGKALMWIANFLQHCTQQVKVGSALSNVTYIISGVIQGSVLGTKLYVILTYSLLNSVQLPLGGFANDLKFIADVVTYTKQAEINKVSDWGAANLMPLLLEKSNVMHCGRNQPMHTYHLHGHLLTAVDTIKNLGLLRSSDLSYMLDTVNYWLPSQLKQQVQFAKSLTQEFQN